MIRLDRGSADFEACFSALVNDRREAGRDVSADVAAILVDVRENGDAAVKALTALFDGFDLDAVGWQMPASAWALAGGRLMRRGSMSPAVGPPIRRPS